MARADALDAPAVLDGALPSPGVLDAPTKCGTGGGGVTGRDSTRGLAGRMGRQWACGTHLRRTLRAGAAVPTVRAGDLKPRRREKPSGGSRLNGVLLRRREILLALPEAPEELEAFTATADEDVLVFEHRF